MTTTSPPSSRINLLDLAAAALASTVSASRPIREHSSLTQEDDGSDKKNARLKGDGSVVTDADFAAQGTIVRALRCISQDVVIVGEESEAEMKQHMKGQPEGEQDGSKREWETLFSWARQEVQQRYDEPVATTTADGTTDDATASTATTDTRPEYEVDVSRVRVFVDPLDGTKSYARGDYDSVTVLIAIILDDCPYFGVICKPFGYKAEPSILDSGCVAVYGGNLLNGVFVAGGGRVPTPVLAKDQLPRAIISESRSEGVVRDFVDVLAAKGVVHPEPIHVSGAGEKSLRLVLGSENEGLWFYPKVGTSRWDVAASDALLRQLGGKVSDKHGNKLDYCKSREASENSEGIIASNNAELHDKCIKLFREGEWVNQ